MYKEMYYVSKRLEIAGAHSLNLPYESKCTNIHGHNWIITIHCKSSKLNAEGMVLDFAKIKKAISDELDHRYINIILGDTLNPTAENMAKWICDKVTDMCDYGHCYKVEVQESEGNIARYTRGDEE